MKKLFYILSFILISLQSFAQIGTVKTESYQADFEKKQSLAVVSNYTDTIILPIQVLQIGINESLYEMYPELKDKRVGLGVANIVLEYLESTERFIFTEDKAEIKNKMIAQDKASAKGISQNEIKVKGILYLVEIDDKNAPVELEDLTFRGIE